MDLKLGQNANYRYLIIHLSMQFLASMWQHYWLLMQQRIMAMGQTECKQPEASIGHLGKLMVVPGTIFDEEAGKKIGLCYQWRSLDTGYPK